MARCIAQELWSTLSKESERLWFLAGVKGTSAVDLTTRLQIRFGPLGREA